jgi:EAL domain-containing protein (putative c-di-GMP-specific phosphodiesterase class I)/ActR/RegA family two-component response regulator
MSLADLHVMLVEDHGIQRRLGLRLLSELGLTHLNDADGGESALLQLRAMAAPPDVILVDLDMPGMDGIEFIGHVAEGKLAHSIAVVSAMDAALLHTVEVMAKAAGLRVLGAVEKPLSPAKLTDLLSTYRDQPAQRARPAEVAHSLDQLREALAAGEVLPFFQPQAEFRSGKIIAVEALARWRQADGSFVSPGEFMPMAESGGLMEAMTAHMLAESCRWVTRWRDEGIRMRVSVNVSASCLTGPEVADRYERLVREQGVSPDHVIIEITESALMADTARGLGMLARLRLKGFGLSVDDFGTGYSSLAQLSQIPFTELKIDQGFVGGAPQQARKRAVIEASIELARKLDLHVVAEGVETMDEWELLAGLGCDLAQGYLVSRPVPGVELGAAIARWRQPGE